MARLDCPAGAVARSPLHAELFPGGDERAVLALSSTALLCLVSLCSCFSMGGFSPLLPEIGRAGALADWHDFQTWDGGPPSA